MINSPWRFSLRRAITPATAPFTHTFTMATLIAIPIFGAIILFQSSIASRIHLLYGTADLVMLTIVAWTIHPRVQTGWQWSLIGGIFSSFTTALPFGVVLASYLGTTGITLLIRRRIWQVPLLAMLLATFLGTILIQGLSILALWFEGTRLPLLESINLIILPSLLLNLLLAFPVYILIGDLANWVYPKEIEA